MIAQKVAGTDLTLDRLLLLYIAGSPSCFFPLSSLSSSDPGPEDLPAGDTYPTA